MLNEFDPRNTNLPPELFVGMKNGDTFIVAGPRWRESFVWDAFAGVGRRQPANVTVDTRPTGWRVAYVPEASAWEKSKQRPNKGPQGHIEPWKRRGRRKI